MTRPALARVAPYAAVGTVALALSMLLWWHVLAHGATVTTCGCGDAALTLWVLAWPAHALAHGLNPFYSDALFHPAGIDMAPNSLGLGWGLAPVTWLFGPVAALNVIDIVAPPLSALGMFWLVRRWVTWTPAAAAAGLFYAFSPFALTSLALAHPNFGLLAIPPVIVGLVCDLAGPPRRPVWQTGIALGAAVAVEFLISVEVLLLLVLAAGAAIAVQVAWWTATDRARLRSVGPSMARGAAVATVAAGALLAVPLWYFFAGPARLTGRAWPTSPPGVVGSTLGDFVGGTLPRPLVEVMHAFGGYQGPALPALSFLGAGAIAVVAAGAVALRRERVVRWFAGGALVAAVLSLGVGAVPWAPWRLFTHVPLVDDVVPVNVTSITVLCVAVLLGIVVDRARQWARTSSTRAGTAAGGALALAAAVPVIAVLWPNLPMTVRPVQAPAWFTRPAPSGTGRPVVLPYPPAFGGIQSSMAWQATGGFSFDMVGGGGPGVVPQRAGPERPGFEVLGRAAVPLGPAPVPDAATVAAVRAALAGWQVTEIVVPDQPGLPTYDRGRPVPYAVGFFTAAVGRAPVLRDRAWVWNDVARLSPAAPLSAARFDACTAGPATTSPAITAVAACVLGAGPAR